MLSFYQWIKRINKFLFKLSIKEKLLFIEAFFLTGLMRAKILKVPFNKLKEELGTYNTESVDDVVLDDYKKAKIVRDVVVTISKFTPWESLCLVQAMTVQRMLKKRGISTTIYLGVNKENKNMVAHAWIRCGKMFVTGGDGSGYATVAKFSN
ncbi:lasso peptide biosynthesis B2 protein [Romboutsia lituseburensis]|uniref:lasso peptide biosynthesis B2 protein n=1 Tax=Romboutsia lituseburensis TaxID=1537 RepID=UPI0022EAC39C|nr:lasso peptide biosynthesis B2 protein [Romboutsia lituseburensis]